MSELASKPRAVFLDKASLLPEDLGFQSLNAIARWQWFDNVDDNDVQRCIQNAEIIVTNKVEINQQAIVNSKKLKLICVAATGYDQVDVAVAKQFSVTVCNVRAYATASVAQHVFTLVLALSRNLLPYKESVATGNWSRSDFFCYFGRSFSDLEGKSIGIIGYGELGRAVAKIAECFGMKVLVAHSYKTVGKSVNREPRIDLNLLLATADVVTLHCPLSEDNHHLINAQSLAMMKSDAILINTARGGLVDEAALLHAVKNHQIGGAGLDVLQEEPPSLTNPLINLCSDNLIITPHIAWASRESRQRLVNEITKNIQAYQRGTPRNVV
ncbi:MAG: glycerate dehydrogenase [Gammaproteobacteria bacterium]|nr:MAG: glycerate dehydrogenase [Gammaproteobacteria bacterium]